jgi:hypothetical protein
MFDAAARSEENRELPYYFLSRSLEKKDRERRERELSTMLAARTKTVYFVYQPVLLGRTRLWLEPGKAAER